MDLNTRGEDLSAEDKLSIIKWHEDGFSDTYIASIFKEDVFTVERVIRDFQPNPVIPPQDHAPSEADDEHEESDDEDLQSSDLESRKDREVTVLQPSEEQTKDDPSLLQKHSDYKEYTTKFGHYQSIRTFYRDHGDNFIYESNPKPLPLLVFIHGIGGALSDFQNLISSLKNNGPCLGIDFPGCGLSALSPDQPEAYSTAALAALLATVITEYQQKSKGQGLVLIATGTGATVAAILASPRTHCGSGLRDSVLAVIVICPDAPTTKEDIEAIGAKFYDLSNRLNALSSIPGSFPPVSAASRLQAAIWMVSHLHHQYDESGRPIGPDYTWPTIKTNVLIATAQVENSEREDASEKVAEWLGIAINQSGIKDARYYAELALRRHSNNQSTPEITDQDALQSDIVQSMIDKNEPVIKISEIPPGRESSLIADEASYRTLAGSLEPFLSDSVDYRLSQAWQQKHLTTAGKWDVKNLEKWKRTEPVSQPIANVFYALKTLRDVDEEHTPKKFAETYAGKIYAIIDTSSDRPFYTPEDLEAGGIKYYKIPMESKYTPQEAEVDKFIAAVDEMRAQIPPSDHPPLIGVHCHYGFNRTGFLIVSYLVLKGILPLHHAIAEFRAKRRPHGIKHEYFINTLFTRYSTGLRP